MGDFGHKAASFAGAHIDVWGAGPFVISYHGKTWRFEDSDRFGPAILTKQGAVSERPMPSQRSPFWIAHYLWVRQGRRLENDGMTCIVDPPRPTIVRKVGGMRFLVEEGDRGGETIEIDGEPATNKKPAKPMVWRAFVFLVCGVRPAQIVTGSSPRAKSSRWGSALARA